MTTINPGKLGSYDLEINKTFHRLIRSQRSSEITNSSLNNSVFAFDYANSAYFDYDIANFDSDFGICILKFSLDNMADNNTTLKELATLDVICQPWCQSYELKSRLIHLLPKFHDLAGIPCRITPHGIPEDYIMTNAFPFSLDRVSKDWLYLQSTLFNTWRDMEMRFLEKFLPTSRTTSIKKEICGIRQYNDETLWLMLIDKSMIDSVSGGVLMDKTPIITDLTSLVRQLAIGQHHTSPPARVYGICASIEHPTDTCPTLQEIELNSFTFPEGFGEVDGNKQHLLSTKCDCYNSGHANTYLLTNCSQMILDRSLLKQSSIQKVRSFELDEELLQTFRKVEINIPLLDAIKQILKYAKFFKELCTHKRKKLKGDVEIISECTFVDAMLDLGALINAMPLLVYRSLRFGDLEPTSVIIELVNRSIVIPLAS
ncbi:hypothetical protein CR513_22144, partial [Mucuna pruriens]